MSDTEVVTFGCRLNAYESEAIRRRADEAGLTNAVIVNTCAVTGEAVRQSRQAIRKLRRERPTAKIIVTGCAAQVEPETYAAMPEVDQVLGNAEKLDAASYSADFLAGAERVRVNDIMAVKETASQFVDSFDGRVRAVLQVQNGCDHRCTFCIIPYGRGPSRSVGIGAVVEEARALVRAGFQEIVLSGVDLTSYGHDLPGQPKLGALVSRLLSLIPEMKRLRLSSFDAVEADEMLLRAIAEEPRLMPHFHLSVQAGDDLTLKRMKRRHLRKDIVEFCAEIRRLRPEIAFGADFIAGFPTETEAMFQNTMDLIDEAGLSFLHVFPFSPRRGTPAAKMPQVARGLIKERAARLRAKGAAAMNSRLESLVGREMRVLVEKPGMGRTECFAPVQTPLSVEAGSIIRARITSHDGARLIGAMSDTASPPRAEVHAFA